MIYLKNTKEKQTIYIPRTELYTEQYVNPVKTYEEGYNDGFDKGVDKGIEEQKSKLETIVINDNGTYEREDGYNKVIVEYQDLNGSYDDGYNDGKNDGYNEGKEDGYNDGYDEGYDVGYTDGGDNQKSKLEIITITENGSYSREDGYSNIEVNVPDLNGSYDEGYANGKSEGYAEGKNDGIDEQKSKLESISITENGTYTKEDGYNEIVVEVPDVNGSYDDGYSEGYDKGKDDGYAEGIEEGVNNAGEIIAQTAQVLNVTENGLYTTKYSYPEDFGREITGYFDDGTPFYNYALLIKHYSKTDITLQPDSVVEIWVKPNGWKTWYGGESLFADRLEYPQRFCIKINNPDDWGQEISATINNTIRTVKYNIEDKWYHFVLSEAGLFIDGEKVTEGFDGAYIKDEHLYILGGERNTDGYYGMIKVTSNGVVYTIIPTENGFKNITTDTFLEVVEQGTYNYNGLPEFEGNLVRTVNVNVQPKISVVSNKIKLGYSKFTEIPEFYDFDNVTDTSNMFYYCTNITTIPPIDTSKVRDMSYMFYGCNTLKTIPPIDTSKVTSMSYMFYGCITLKTIPSINTSNVTGMANMFNGCASLTTIPQLNTSNVTNMYYMFYNCKSLESLPALNFGSISSTSNINRLFYTTITSLTDLGGFLDLKVSWNDDYGLKVLPNLTYQSCINVLNGLYDFTGNNQTPSSSQGKLKVHANFLTTVGDEISIGTNKGWTITS
jgi:surface protein